VRCRFPLPSALLHELRLFLKRAVDFAVHAPTGERRLGGTMQRPVPKPDAPVHAVVKWPPEPEDKTSKTKWDVRCFIVRLFP
jgi:hypothetical protein